MISHEWNDIRMTSVVLILSPSEHNYSASVFPSLPLVEHQFQFSPPKEEKKKYYLYNKQHNFFPKFVSTSVL